MGIYGQIKGLDPIRLQSLLQENIFPFKPAGDSLEVDYEGHYIDIEPLLDLVVRAMDKNGRGHVDCINHQDWEVLRYRIENGAWSCKKINPDNPLEAYKWQ